MKKGPNSFFGFNRKKENVSTDPLKEFVPETELDTLLLALRDVDSSYEDREQAATAILLREEDFKKYLEPYTRLSMNEADKLEGIHRQRYLALESIAAARKKADELASIEGFQADPELDEIARTITDFRIRNFGFLTSRDGGPEQIAAAKAQNEEFERVYGERLRAYLVPYGHFGTGYDAPKFHPDSANFARWYMRNG